MKMNFDGSSVNQYVGLNYEENCIEIQPPAIEGKTAPTLIHDVTEVKLYIFL